MDLKYQLALVGEKFEHVKEKAQVVRMWLSENPQVATIVAVVIIAISWIFIYRYSSPPSYGPIPDAYFYDMNTGELFTAPSDRNPPIETDSGPYTGEFCPPKLRESGGLPAGVIAHVFACGDCSEENRKIAYVEMYTPRLKQMLENRDELTEEERYELESSMEMHRLVMKPDETDEQKKGWRPYAAPGVYEYIEAANKPCPDGEYPLMCFPGD